MDNETPAGPKAPSSNHECLELDMSASGNPEARKALDELLKSDRRVLPSTRPN